MRRVFQGTVLVVAAIAFLAPRASAANKETVDSPSAYIAQRDVRVDVFAHNEVGLFEYFNLVLFDSSKLEFVGIAADRGSLWYGLYPTRVSNDSIFVHGVAGGFGSCLDPDWGEPGSPLYHLTFHVKDSATAGLAVVRFGSQAPYDGHWNNCSGYQINPGPQYYDGGIDILGHAGHVTVESDSAGAGEPVAIDVYLHNDLDVFEYFHRVLFQSSMAFVDSIVPVRGELSYGNYPTSVSGDTVFVHGWAAGENCFPEDPSFPGAALYRIHFHLQPWATPGTVMPLTFLEEGTLWNHWVGCDLVTTDSFTATDGSISVLQTTGVERPPGGAIAVRLAPAAPNPSRGRTAIRFYLPEPGPVTLTVHDVTGRRIRMLQSGPRPAGWNEVTWDGADEQGREVVAGTYFYRLRTGSGTLTRRMVRIR